MGRPLSSQLAALTAAVVAGLALLLVLSNPEPASPDGLLTLGPATTSAPLAPHFQYLPDSGQNPAQLIAALQAGQAMKSAEQAFDAVVPYQAIWALARLRIQEPERRWQISSQIHGVVGLKILITDAAGRGPTVFDYSARKPVSRLDFTGPTLTTRPFQAKAGQDYYVLAAIKRGPVASVALILQDQTTRTRNAIAESIGLTAFYGLAIASLAFFFFFVLAANSPRDLGYVILLILGLAVVAYIDGLLFRFLYSGHPGWHLPIGLILLFAFSGSGFLAAAARFQGPDAARAIPRILQGAAVLSAVGAVLVFIAPAEILAPVSYVMAVLMFAGHLTAFVRRGQIYPAPPLTQAMAVFCSAVCLLIVVLLFAGRLDGALSPGFLIRAFYAVVAVWIMTGIVWGVVEMRRQREAALASEAQAQAQAAETATALLQAERNYFQARDLAQQRSRQLATASHDLKQPILSLRMALADLARDQDPGVRNRLTEAFDYIEDLSQSYLTETTPACATA